MKKLEGPVTDENFSSVWKYIDRKLIEIKKKHLVSNILKFTSNIAFLLSMLMITYVALRFVEEQIDLICLSSVPIFNDVWNLIHVHFLDSNTDFITSLPTLLILGFLFPFFVNLFTFFLVWIVYQPKHNEETGNKESDSKTLLDMSKELSLRKKSETGISSLLYGFLYMLGILNFLFLMILKFLSANEFMILIPLFKVVSPFTLMGAMAGPDVNFAAGYLRYAIFIVIFIYVAYTFLNIISNLLVRFLYKTKVKTFLTDEIEEYCYMQNPSLKEEKEQESEIIRKASAIRLKETNREPLTEEDLAILKESSEIIEKRKNHNKNLLHVNPVFKTINVCVNALIILFVIISIHKIVTLDFQGIYAQLDIPSVVDSIPMEEVAPMIESITEEDLLAVCSNIPEKDYKNIINGLSKVSALDISKDISKEEFSDKIGNMTLEDATELLNNLTDEDLFNILDGLPKETINEYFEGINMYEDLYGEPNT